MAMRALVQQGLPTTMTLQLRSADSFSARPWVWKIWPFFCRAQAEGRGADGHVELKVGAREGGLGGPAV